MIWKFPRVEDWLNLLHTWVDTEFSAEKLGPNVASKRNQHSDIAVLQGWFVQKKRSYVTNCLKESFIPSRRTFGHNSFAGQRLSSRKKRNARLTHLPCRQSAIEREEHEESLWHRCEIARWACVAFIGRNPRYSRDLMRFLYSRCTNVSQYLTSS